MTRISKALRLTGGQVAAERSTSARSSFGENDSSWLFSELGDVRLESALTARTSACCSLG
jgi:hypothetical protein